MVANAARMPYAVFAGDRLVGMTAWLRPDVSAQTIEIGSSYIHPDVRGTGLNGRMNRLMLGHAFAVGIRRVEFRIHERNPRNPPALTRLGPAQEGPPPPPPLTRPRPPP